MSLLVLVHGGFHGAWSWNPLLPALHTSGHRVLAVDLPVDRIGAGPDAYADVICDAMREEAGDDAILIGHSLGGALLPRVALRRKVAGLVYLCPAVPPLNEAGHAQNLDAFGTGLTGKFNIDGQGLVTMTPEDAIFAFYQDAPQEIASWAAARLRPQWAGAMSTTYSPMEFLPEVATRAIICTDDRVLQRDKTRRLIQQRLHTDPTELPGGHSPFLSRPADLAALLDGFIHDFSQS